MIVVMKPGASQAELAGVVERIEGLGFRPTSRPVRSAPSSASSATVGRWTASRSSGWPASTARCRFCSPSSWPAATFTPRTRWCRSTASTSAASGIVVMAGPCAVESREQILETAQAVKAAGGARAARRRLQAAHVALQLSGAGRGGAASCWPRRARRPGLPIVTEVMAPRAGAAGGRATPTSCRSARATCRTTRCCTPWASRSGRCCSSAA